MRHPSETYRSRVYLNFKEIDAQQYRSIVQFFEQNENDIRELSFEEYFELLLAYADALFEVGAYSNFLDCCDYIIESVIYFNVNAQNGEDIYRKLLFRKAASCYHTMEYAKCEHILSELLKMDPKDELAIMLQRRCFRAQPSKVVRKTRITSVLLFLISAGVIAVELLAINNFFPEYGKTAEYTRNGIFALGWLVLLSGGIYQLYSANKRLKSDLKELNLTKSPKE